MLVTINIINLLLMIYDWERGSVAGVEHMEGNMFEHIPSADAVMMKVTISSMVFCLHKKFTAVDLLRANNILLSFTAVDYP